MTDYTGAIWKWLKINTQLPDEAIAGIMGNMQEESNCEPCRLQGDFSADRAKSTAFAHDVDSGVTGVFYSGKYGWGLCQWTYPQRCKNLYAFCTERGKSISDLETQLSFMVWEMENEYKSTWKQLLLNHDITNATSLVLNDYEMPAERAQNLIRRSNHAKGFYARFHDQPVEQIQFADDIDIGDVQLRGKVEQLLNLTSQASELAREIYSGLYDD